MVSTITIKEKTGEVKERIRITGELKTREKMTGNLNATIYHIFPELENIEIIPSKELQTFKAEEYGFEEVMVKGVTSDIDENIKPEFIKEGVNILGVDGGYRGIDTSDATATADDLLQGKTAYINNQKVEGTIKEYDGSYSGNTVKEVKITNADFLFYDGSRIDYMNEILTLCHGVVSTKSMFSGCDELTSLDLNSLDTSNVTNMQNMFYNCTKLESIKLNNFNTSKVTNMSSMFYNCEKLPSLDLSSFDTSNVTNMSNMFYGCDKVKTIDVSSFNTSNVTNMQSMFGNCVDLISLDLSGFDMSKVTKINGMFTSAYDLVDFKSPKNIGKGFTRSATNFSDYKVDLAIASKITYESLMDLMNNLYDLNLTYDVANGGTLYTQSLVLGSTNLAKLTSEEIAIATNKGWTVS